MRFQILRGKHIPKLPELGKDPVMYTPIERDDGNPHIIETDKDLVAEWGSLKFHRLPDLAPLGEKAGENKELDQMTVAELRSLADVEEIDLEGCTAKKDILEMVRSALV